MSIASTPCSINVKGVRQLICMLSQIGIIYGCIQRWTQAEWHSANRTATVNAICYKADNHNRSEGDVMREYTFINGLQVLQTTQSDFLTIGWTASWIDEWMNEYMSEWKGNDLCFVWEAKCKIALVFRVSSILLLVFYTFWLTASTCFRFTAHWSRRRQLLCWLWAFEYSYHKMVLTSRGWTHNTADCAKSNL